MRQSSLKDLGKRKLRSCSKLIFPGVKWNDTRQKLGEPESKRRKLSKSNHWNWVDLRQTLKDTRQGNGEKMDQRSTLSFNLCTIKVLTSLYFQMRRPSGPGVTWSGLMAWRGVFQHKSHDASTFRFHTAIGIDNNAACFERV